MARTGIYKSEVKKARDALLDQGRRPSVDAVRVELGNTGSKTTIHRYLQELAEEEGGGFGKQVAVSDALQYLVTQVWISQQLTLLAVSPQICQRQQDWPASVHSCGFLDMPGLELDGTIPAGLAAFLDAGDAPVYMSLGSWMPKDIPGQTSTLRMLTQAAELVGCRAIIQSPAWQDCGFKSSDQLLYVSAAPHHAVFPHCRAVVHHGGAGTTQSATLAGKPSVVVAHISEQEHWGRELHRIGIAGKPMKRRNVTAEELARTIRVVQNTPEMNVRATAIARAMSEESGVAEAVKLIAQKFG